VASWGLPGRVAVPGRWASSACARAIAGERAGARDGAAVACLKGQARPPPLALA